MKTKHSPGDWIICTIPKNSSVVSIEQDRDTIVDEPAIIAEVELMGEGLTKRIGMANARLIAAAPKLLAALQPFANLAEYSDVCEKMATALRPHEQETLRSAFQQARAAIAKATGVQS